MPTLQATAELPPVTDAHRRAAFAAMAWAGWTYEAAMASDTRRRAVEARAHRIRKDEWLASQRRTVVPVHRCRPGLDGHPMKWCTQLAPGPMVPETQPDLLDTEQ